MVINKNNISCLLLNPKNKFLLIKRSSKDDSFAGFWELPSGGIEDGEEMVNTVKREVQEETGVDLKDYECKKVDFEKYSFTKDNGDIKNINETTFFVKIEDTPEITLSEEHTDYQWVSLEELDSVFADKEDMIYKRIYRIFEKNHL